MTNEEMDYLIHNRLDYFVVKIENFTTFSNYEHKIPEKFFYNHLQSF